MRIGFSYDVHELVSKRKLTLGGVEVPFKKGLQGHSDADVLSHAIGEAIIGALGEGDLGKHFPDTWDEFKGISSIILLEKIYILLTSKGFEIENIDSSIVAQKPKLADHISAMKEKIKDALHIESNQVNIKATTTEGLGFAGREEGIAAYAVVLIKEKKMPAYAAKKAFPNYGGKKVS